VTALGLLVRWVHLASGITLVGTFLLLLLAGRPPKPTAARWEADALGLARAAVLLALVAGLGALAVQTVVLEGRPAALLEAPALARVLGATRFGTVWIFRHGLLLLLAAFLLVRLPVRTAADRTALCAQGLLLGAIALGAAAWAGHAAAAEPSPLRASAVDALHLAGAGAWLGGLAPLAWLLRRAARPEHADARPYAVLAARRFSRLALAAVLALVATGVLNAWSQVGSVAALLGTPYGRLLVLKLLLLAPILALAAVNRRRLLPALSGEGDAIGRPAMRRLAVSLGLEGLLALAVLAVVAWMTVTPPGRHVEPTWPFGFRLSWEATADLPGVRLRVLAGALLALVGLLAALAGLLARRPRLGFAGGATPLALAAIVALPPLAVAAHPTTYRRPAVPYQAVSIASGADLYAGACASCHSRGAGDLTGRSLARRTAGDLYWSLTHGLSGTRMPGFGGSLTAEQRWDLVNFLRARADAEQARALGPAVRPPGLVAPDFAYAVGPSTTHTLRELRGRRVALLVLFTLPESRPRMAEIAQAYEGLVVMGAEVIAVPTRAERGIIKRLGASPRIFFPVVTEGAPDIVRTYELFGPGRGHPSHMEFLVDRSGYLRARILPDLAAPPAMSELLDQILKLNQEPQPASLPDDHVH
jgi:putative copper resistance protein D